MFSIEPKTLKLAPIVSRVVKILVLKDLENSNQDSGINEYLRAVIGARTAKENLLFESLQKAVRMDNTLKAHAKTDQEFALYFENPKFN